jgi:putative ABC transport system ATP-binding protein
MRREKNMRKRREKLEPIETKNIIEIKALNKSYQMGEESLHVLKNVDFSVETGEFVAILGPSGSGKSTLMNVIGCMDQFDKGEYYLDGMPVHRMKGEELTQIRNEKIGFVFQNYHLIPAYTVLQNVIMPLLMRGIDHRTAEEMCMETLEMLGLTDRIGHKPNELSGGQRQRVAIARALVGQPSILLADEPSGALDSKMGKEVLKLFAKLNDMGNTIVMITHDLEVAKAAQRVVRIIDGNLYVEA